MGIMDLIKMNQKAIKIVEKWNPFNMENFSYETEAADVVEALQFIDDPSDMGKKIQEIYALSFEKWIPFEKCVALSYKLLAVKFAAKNIV